MKTKEFNLKDEIAVLEMELRYNNLNQLEFFRKLDEIMEEFVRKLKEELRSNILETEINGVPLALKCAKTMDRKIDKLAGKYLEENKK